MMLVLCFPASAQTNLTRSVLVVYQDLNNTPKLYVGNQTIQTIVIARSTRTIPPEAFVGTSVRNITFEIPSSVTEIPYSAFSDNYFLTYVHLPESLVTIGGRAFGSCSRLQRVVLPSGLKTIWDAAFWNTSIRRLYIPDSVTVIGGNIFFNTMTIESVRLPANADVDSSNPFYQTYMQSGRNAGIYAKINDMWIYRQDRPENEYYNSVN
jgi:hypothetical protein